MSSSEAEGKAVAPRTLWGKVRKVLGSTEFIEKALLLCATVVLSGLAVPLVVSHINSRLTTQQKLVDEERADRQRQADAARAQQQKAVDEARARSEAIVQAQARMLREYSEAVYEYVTLALDVSWFGSRTAHNLPRQVLAANRYNDRIVDVWTKWRVVVSQAYILASPAIAEKMKGMLDEVYQMDVRLVQMMNDPETSVDQWSVQHNRAVATFTRFEVILQELARDMNLASDQAAR